LTKVGYKVTLDNTGCRVEQGSAAFLRVFMIMRIKYTIFAVSVAFSVLAMNSGLQAINTRGIDRVRSKEMLDREDFQIIDNFVGEAVQKLVKTKDFTSIAKTRMVILARDSSSKESAAAQYAEQFSESAYKYISLGLKQAGELTSQDRKFKVILNLLILVDGLENLRLADLSMKMLNDENTVIQYWAVHSVTTLGITRQLNSGGADNLELAVQITQQLKKLVEGASTEILALIAEFAAEVNVPEGEDLLLQIADMRISKYADWTVDYELLDATILGLLCSKVSSAGRSNPATARRFGQLYSYAIQRYVRGQNYLSDTEKRQLVSVLVETEDKCIGKLSGMPQSVIKRAIENNDYTALLLEHNRLLGDEMRAGKLGLRLNFDYGKTSSGAGRTAPLVLPEPPRAEASESRQKLKTKG